MMVGKDYYVDGVRLMCPKKKKYTNSWVGDVMRPGEPGAKSKKKVKHEGVKLTAEEVRTLMPPAYSLLPHAGASDGDLRVLRLVLDGIFAAAKAKKKGEAAPLLDNGEDL